MARIVLSTFGSSGDFNPFVALGLELRERGHDVVFAVQDLFAPVVAEQGFALHRLSGNVVAAMAGQGTKNLGASNPIPSVRALVQYGIMPVLDTQVGELGEACQDADLLVTSYGQLAGSFVASECPLPWATVAFSPITIPSAYMTTMPLPIQLPPRLQRQVNRLQWRVGSLVLRQIADRPINRVRSLYHLQPLHEALWLGAASPQLVCVTCSPAFQPRPPDWPNHVRMTGFCYWDGAAAWESPPELVAFQKNRRPYVVVTAGSIASPLGDVFADYFRTSVEAILSAGARALVIGQSPDAAPRHDDVLRLPFVPYSAVFPSSAAVIHHGGIGTTAQALRAGVPSLVVPWGVDQFYTAAQVTRSGAGKFLYWRQFTPARASVVLTTLMTNPSYKNHGQALSKAIAGENGAAVLCEAVLALL
jgi:rhamnosyltransferase subunit B